MESQNYINSLIERSRAAQQVVENYTQEEVDAIVKAIAKIIYDHAEDLARDAVEETRLGFFDNKLVLNQRIPLTHWDYLKDKKSVGVIDNDPIACVKTIAKPMGIVGCLTPCTNPTPTPLGNAMCAIKGRNSVIVAPHPRAKKVTCRTVELMRDEIKKLGAPEDLILIVEEPTLELTNLLIQAVDVVVATGGYGMVKAAYSSGKPSFGVGQGNAQVIVDRGYGNHHEMAKGIISNRSTDNGLPCIGEQTLILPNDEADQILSAFTANGAYIVDDPAVVDHIRSVLFQDGVINKDIVGTPAPVAAKMLGLNDVPDDTRILLVRCSSFGKDEVLCKEVMCPIIRVFTYDKFADGVAIARANLLFEGAGHSSSVYSHNEAHIEFAANALPVGRVIVNQPNAGASGLAYTNGLVPTVSIGCGTWGNNTISENLSYKHLLNVTKVAYRIENAVSPSADEVWNA